MSTDKEEEPKANNQQKTEVQCSSCGKVLASVRTLLFHREKLHSHENKCLLCNRFLFSHESPKDHLSKFHEINQPITCFCCGWTFSNMSDRCVHRVFFEKTGSPVAFPIIVNGLEPGSLAPEKYSNRIVAKTVLKIWQGLALANENPPNTDAHLFAVWSYFYKDQPFLDAASEWTESSPTTLYPSPSTDQGHKSYMIKDLLELEK